MSPRVVFGMPAYNRPDTLARTLESLLSQSYGDHAIVIVDDCPSAEVAKIVETYAALDSRITYETNPVRLGMIGNWRKAFYRSREIHPGAEYFAWVSDHDVWHPRWLESLVPVLDRHPEVVLTYPQTLRMFANERRRVPGLFDTAGITRPEDRLRVATEKMTAGNCIYGLCRANALEQAGVFRPVMLPDRQVLLQLALVGEFRQVLEYLWYREVAREFSFQRQREAFFPARIPLYTYVPANVQHSVALLWTWGLRGRGRPAVGRLAGLRYAALQFWYSVQRDVHRRSDQLREAFEETAIGQRVMSSRPARAADDEASAAEAAQA